MGAAKQSSRILLEVDEELIGKMPEWFKRLREAYIKKSFLNQRK
jgi:hypothetical protein